MWCTDNSKRIASFACHLTQTLFKWLNRRGKRGCYVWGKFTKLLKSYPTPNPQIAEERGGVCMRAAGYRNVEGT